MNNNHCYNSVSIRSIQPDIRLDTHAMRAHYTITVIAADYHSSSDSAAAGVSLMNPWI